MADETLKLTEDAPKRIRDAIANLEWANTPDEEGWPSEQDIEAVRLSITTLARALEMEGSDVDAAIQLADPALDRLAHEYEQTDVGLPEHKIWLERAEIYRRAARVLRALRDGSEG